MAFHRRYQHAECKTIDGTTIAGWLYTVDGSAPAIIMSHGVGFSLQTVSVTGAI
jgi:hypothetical protein